MEEWKEYKLEEVCKSIADGDHMPPPKSDKGIPFVTISNIVDNRLDFSNTHFVPQSYYDGLDDKRRPHVGDTIYSVVGTFGKPVYVKEEKPFVFQRHIAILRPDESKIVPQFLFYSLLSPQFYRKADVMAIGAVQRTISLTSLRNATIQLPSLEIQSKIVDMLSSLDAKIEVNRQINDNFVIDSFCQILLIWMLTTLINDNLEQQAQALFKSWFVDFEPFRDQSFVESELGMIPDGWRVVALDELCSFISRGLTPKYDERSDELILGQTCVRNNIVTLDNARKHKPKQKTEKWVQQWDTLINSTGVGSLGRVGIVYFNMDNVAIDSHITVVRPKTALLRHFVGRNLLSRQLEIENMAVGSTGQTELPKDRVKYLPIIMPDENALKHFNAVIEPIARLLYRNIEESRFLASLRDILLPRLMSGEIKVNDLIA